MLNEPRRTNWDKILESGGFGKDGYNRFGFNEDGRHRIHVLASKGWWRDVETELKAGTSVNCLCQTGNERTALHCASFGNHTAIIRVLIEGKANMNAVDAHGNTPLGIAIANQAIDVVEMLLKHGADQTAVAVKVVRVPLTAEEHAIRLSAKPNMLTLLRTTTATATTDPSPATSTMSL
jgi:ankyrin repeat protein